jgi:hypothetical protein
MPKAIALEWKGKTYRISEAEAFEVGELVEDIICLAEIPEMAKRPKFFKIARVYGEMLRFAGAKVTNDEVFSAMMDQVKAAGGGEEQKVAIAFSALAALVDILMDGAPSDEGDDGKKVNAS